jgi:4-hydroxybenzoate polyprenyltransferase
MRQLAIRGLVRACHPGACIAIAALMVILAARYGAASGTLALFGLTALAGQVSIGWSNDYFDADFDLRAARTDKPIVTGVVGRRPVGVAALLTLLLAIVSGFLVNATTGGINLVMLGAGWAYNAGLKRTAASVLLYVIGFGLIPPFAAAASGVGARWGTVAVAALLAVAGHFANVLADAETDLSVGVNGLPQRIVRRHGTGTVRMISSVLLVGASLVTIWVLVDLPVWVGVTASAVVTGLAAIGYAVRGRSPFVIAFVIVFINVGALVAST